MANGGNGHGAALGEAGFTKGEKGDWKAKIAREAHNKQIRKWRVDLRNLRTEIKRLRGELAAALKSARAGFRERRKVVRQIIKERRAQVLAELRVWANGQRQAARDVAAAERATIRHKYGDTIAGKQRQAEADARYLRDVAGVARAVTKRKESSLKELRQESDDAVRASLEPHLLPLWEKARKRIKGSSRASRLEQFLEEVAADEDSAVLAQMAEADARIKADIAEFNRLQQLERELLQAQKRGPVKAVRQSQRERRAAMAEAPFLGFCQTKLWRVRVDPKWRFQV